MTGVSTCRAQRIGFTRNLYLQHLVTELALNASQMASFRRLFVGLLAVAVTHFGVMATAPAHAHEGGGSHGMREIVLTHDHEDAADEHHDDAGEHQDEASAADVPSGSVPTDDSNHGEHAHVHGTPQFTTASAVIVTTPVVFTEQAWPSLRAPPASNSSFPPHRPPRAIL